MLDLRITATLATIALAASCGGETVAPPAVGDRTDPLRSSLRRGRDIWFHATYGGEKFFSFLAAHPDPQKRIRLAFEELVDTPRSQRFETWGVINDPDCSANPAGGPDLCPDPTATGVIGIKRFAGPGGTTRYGVTCASCHAGFDPLEPPADPAEPSWDNIHPSVGNQYLKTGKLFAFNLAADDPRRIMFDAWPDGTVDTTVLFNDHIMNPGVITPVWAQRFRPTFDVGLGEPKLRGGQGGEDNLGGDVAALRVYTNIGVCFAECVAPGPGRPTVDTPIDVAQCRAACPELPPQRDLDDLGAFLRSIPSPRFPGVPWNVRRYARGSWAFGEACASCHDRSGLERHALTNDRVNPLGPDATNACRALTTNWDAGHIWAPFSSSVYKDRGFKGYRTMPLVGVWATAPFLHNQSIGHWAPATASPEERVWYYEAAMKELLSPSRPPRVNVLPVAVGPFPAGSPLAYVFSRDPATGAVLCADTVENRGHHHGSGLSSADQEALIYWLRFQ